MANPMTPPEELLERIEKLRQRQKPRLQETTVTMVHGAGGKATHALVEAVFLEAFRNPILERLEDQATFELDGRKWAITTDAFTVAPLFFQAVISVALRCMERSTTWRRQGLAPFS